MTFFGCCRAQTVSRSGEASKWRPLVHVVTLSSLGICFTVSLIWIFEARSPFQAHVNGTNESYYNGILDFSKTEERIVIGLMPFSAIFLGGAFVYLLLFQYTVYHLTFSMMFSLLINYFLGLVLMNAAYAYDVGALLYLASIFNGIGGPAFCLFLTLYSGEIAVPSMRGTLISIAQLMVVMTSLIVYGFLLMEWQYVAWGYVIAPASLWLSIFFSFLKCMTLMESPLYYARKQKDEEGEKAVKVFRGPDYDRAQEFFEIKQKIRTVSSDPSQQTVDRVSIIKPISVKELSEKKIYFNPLLVVLGLITAKEWSGITLVFAQKALIISFANEDAKIAGIVSSSAILGGTLITVFLVDKVGRRPLLLSSQIVLLLALFGLGTFFKLVENQCLQGDQGIDILSCDFIAENGWLALFLLVLFLFSYGVGIGTISNVFLGEAFSFESKSISGFIVFIWSWVCAFVTLSFGEDMYQSRMGISGSFFLFGSLQILATIFIILSVPETMGKSDEQLKKVWDPSYVDTRDFQLIKQALCSNGNLAE